MSDIITVYLQNQAIRAVIDDHYSLRNIPMYDNPITVTKNVSTTLGLEVKRIDRKVLKLMPDKVFYLNVMSKDGEVFLLRKEFEVFNTQRGQLQITIEPDDIDAIDTGMYTYSVTYIDADTGQEKLLHTTPNTTTYSDFIIESNSMPVKRKPFVQYHLTKVRTVLEGGVPTDKDTYVSSRLPITKDTHTLTLSFTNFSGTVKVQATNDIDPTDQVSFFDVQTFDYTEETGDAQFELVTANKDHKYYRIRIITTVLNEGTVDKLEYN